MTTNVYRETGNSEEQLLSRKRTNETFKTLRDLRSEYPKNALLGHLNVNSL